MKTFREFLKERSHDDSVSLSTLEVNLTKMEYYELINEGVIYPIKITIPYDYSHEDLNKRFKDYKIKFLNNDKSYYRDGNIYIGVIRNNKRINNKDLEGIISHEMIHAVQDERSSSNFTKWRDKVNLEANTLLDDLENNIDRAKYLINLVKKDNPYEKMAYAYQIVTQLKQTKTLKEIIEISKKYFGYSDKEFLRYLGIYYKSLL